MLSISRWQEDEQQTRSLYLTSAPDYSCTRICTYLYRFVALSYLALAAHSTQSTEHTHQYQSPSQCLMKCAIFDFIFHFSPVVCMGCYKYDRFDIVYLFLCDYLRAMSYAYFIHFYWHTLTHIAHTAHRTSGPCGVTGANIDSLVYPAADVTQ